MPEWVSTQGGLTLCQAFPFPAQRSHLPEVPRYGWQSWSIARGAHVTRFAVVACNRAAQRVPRGTCGGAALTAAALRGAWLPGGSLLRTRGVEQEGSGTDARPRRAERCRVLTPAQARPVDVSFCCAASRAPR